MYFSSVRHSQEVLGRSGKLNINIYITIRYVDTHLIVSNYFKVESEGFLDVNKK